MVIANNLDQHIHISVNIDCRELRQTSPLSQVVPPNSKAKLPLVFESNTKGRFQRYALLFFFGGGGGWGGGGLIRPTLSFLGV